VGGEDGVGIAGSDERAEEVVADVAGGLFDGLASLGDELGNAGVVDMQGDIEAGAEAPDEVEVGLGLLGGADAVVDVGSAEADAEGVSRGRVGGVEREQKSDGVCAAGDGDADAVSGVDVVTVEGER
jgi:hypothetical protein